MEVLSLGMEEYRLRQRGLLPRSGDALFNQDLQA